MVSVNSVVKYAYPIISSLHGWGGRTRTSECRDQNPVPCHLATPHYPLPTILIFVMIKSDRQLGAPAMSLSQSGSFRCRFISDQLQGSDPPEIIANPYLYPSSDAASPILPFRHCRKGQKLSGRFRSSAHRLPQDPEAFLSPNQFQGIWRR